MPRFMACWKLYALHLYRPNMPVHTAWYYVYRALVIARELSIVGPYLSIPLGTVEVYIPKWGQSTPFHPVYRVASGSRISVMSNLKATWQDSSFLKSFQQRVPNYEIRSGEYAFWHVYHMKCKFSLTHLGRELKVVWHLQSLHILYDIHGPCSHELYVDHTIYAQTITLLT